MSGRWKRVDDGFFTAENGRFAIEAHRRPSGSVRDWSVTDTVIGRVTWHKNRESARVHIRGVMGQELEPETRKKIEAEVKAMLHAHRDSLRNRGVDTSKTMFDCREGFYGEAFGIMRGLVVMGHGHFGSDNVDEPGNVKFWFHVLEKQVLKEEGFDGDGRCEYCHGRYGKDDARPHGR